MYEKYHIALRLMKDCADTTRLVRPENGWPLRPVRFVYKDRVTELECHPCHDSFDACFKFIYANFKEPETSNYDLFKDWKGTHPEFEAMHLVLESTPAEFTRLLYSMPPELAEEVFPVAVARFLLCRCQIPLDYRLLSTFGEFDRRYHTMIFRDLTEWVKIWKSRQVIY